MSRVFIGIGSNQLERFSNVSEAIECLERLPNTRLIKRASIYETEPVGEKDQPDFINTVVEVESSLSPQKLVSSLKKIESDFGRQPSGKKWSQRIIDLDILLYDNVVIKEEGLQIPHSQMEVRRFVLEPLAELSPDLKHPISGCSVVELLKRIPKDEQRVVKVK